MYSLRFTLFLIVMLMIPFMLRVKYGEHLEIYPAVLLPSGVDKLWSSHEQVEIGYTSFAGKNQYGQWKDIDNIRLMRPIPDHYLQVIHLNNDTVTDISGNRFLQLLKGFGILRHDKSHDKMDRMEINSWIKGQLLHEHLDTLLIKQVQHQVTLSTIDGTIVKDHRNERIIQLVSQNQ